MEDKEAATYAGGMAGALRVLGPTPRANVLGMMGGLGLEADAAVAVIAFGLAHGLLVEDAAGRLGVGEELEQVLAARPETSNLEETLRDLM